MRGVVEALETTRRFTGIAMGRMRARWLATKGAYIGSKVLLGKQCSIERPWCTSLGDRASLEQRVTIKIARDTATIRIGKYSFLGIGTVLDVLEELTIGEHSYIAPGVFITDHDHGTSAFSRIDEQPCVSAAVKIGDDVWIGANAVILRGVNIGNGAVVGAGAVVNKNVKEYSIVAGVPAKVVGERGGQNYTVSNAN